MNLQSDSSEYDEGNSNDYDYAEEMSLETSDDYASVESEGPIDEDTLKSQYDIAKQASDEHADLGLETFFSQLWLMLT